MKLLIALVLVSSTVFAQSNSIDAIEIARRNIKKLTRTINTTVHYKMSDLHGNTVNAHAKVKIFFSGEILVAAQRIFETSYRYENYFLYFNNDQVTSIQYNKIGSPDLYVHEFPNIPQWDKPIANAIIAFCRKKTP